MKNSLLDKTYELKDSLQNDKRIVHLNELEKQLNSNDEVIALAYKKDMAADNYSEMVRLFKEDSQEANKAMKNLSEAKANLDNHPLVKEYTKAYQEVRDLYIDINDILFSSLNPSLCPKEEK